jgi:Chaperone of endosialidase
MKKIKFLPTLLSLVFALVCLHVSVSGQSADDKNKFATISTSGSSVRWEINAPHDGLTLTVSAPDGQVFRKEFKANSSPEFTLSDKEGNRLADGQYNYELRLSPVISSDVKKELKASREKNKDDDAAPQREMRKRGLLPSEPMVQSGSFTIQRGTAVVEGGVEENQRTGRKATEQPQQRPVAVPVGNPGVRPRTNHHPPMAIPDQVIPDDLIVQGSLCVGFDCVNNESFGFDTIRLKENNTRIKFEDTSVGSYPTNDWQLTANDSASGGLSKFSIEDITGAKVPFTVEAGATTNSIYIDSTGRVGLRTSTPVLDVHANTSNTPGIRLEQNNSGGFTAQTWDIAGNEANFFVRDVTGGSLLPFRIRPGAPTSSLDIAASGNVGIGSASPQKKLHVVASSATNGIGIGKNNSTDLLVIGYDNTSNFGAIGSFAGGIQTVLALNPLGGNVGIGTTAPTDTLSVNGTASKPGGGSWSVFSDERLKNIKGRFTSGLSAVMQLQPLRYEYRQNNALGLNSNGEHVGFGAQALQKIIPEAVTSTANGYLVVNNDPIIWTMLNAIKEQQKEIEQLKAQIQQLRPRTGNRQRRRR